MMKTGDYIVSPSGDNCEIIRVPEVGVFIGVGSNLAENRARKNIQMAADLLRGAGELTVSGIYSTDAVGMKSAGMIYHNAVFALFTDMSMESLVTELKKIERELGRDRESKEVAIDLDLVLWHGAVVRPVDFSREYFQCGFRHLLNDF